MVLVEFIGPLTSCVAFVAFAVVYLVSAQAVLLLPRSGTLTSLQRYRSASKCMASTHAVIVVAAAFYELSGVAFGTWEYLAPNSQLQSHVMDISTAYFIADSAHMLLWKITDVGFHLHHVLCIAYAMSCRYGAQRGGVTVLLACALGELTNPTQGLLWIVQQLKYERVIAILFPAFVAMLIVIRCVVTPLMSIAIVVALWRSGELLFRAWGGMCIFINIGGVLFTLGQVKALRKMWADKVE